MTRLRGWAPKGERLVDKIPHGRWKTATFLAALRNDRIDAPCLFDGPINGERFRAYVEQFLTPTLKPGDVVILDNLGSHKGKAVRQAPRRRTRLVFLPKYSPDLNPIQRAFAKFKPCCKRPKREHTTLSRMQGRHSRSISARRMRRLCEERRIRVNPKAGRSGQNRPEHFRVNDGARQDVPQRILSGRRGGGNRGRVTLQAFTLTRGSFARVTPPGGCSGSRGKGSPGRISSSGWRAGRSCRHRRP